MILLGTYSMFSELKLSFEKGNFYENYFRMDNFSLGKYFRGQTVRETISKIETNMGTI